MYAYTNMDVADTHSQRTFMHFSFWVGEIGYISIFPKQALINAVFMQTPFCRGRWWQRQLRRHNLYDYTLQSPLQTIPDKRLRAQR